MNNSILSVFAINLKKRIDRKNNLTKEFVGRLEFKLRFIEPIADSRPNVSLWKTIVHIVSRYGSKDEAIVICEDDHQFTKDYSKERLFECIQEAEKWHADILSGGVSCVGCTHNVSSELLWMDSFTGMQFTIVFPRFFKSILDFQFLPGDDADIAISGMTENKFVMHPFISTQKYFGYSDVTANNSVDGRVDNLFAGCAEEIRLSTKVTKYYQNFHGENLTEDCLSDKDSISTYVIVEDLRDSKTEVILREFAHKKEFNISLIKAVYRKKQNLGAWMTLRKIIENAIRDDDDLVIICEAGHRFTEHYNKNMLLHHIVNAHAEHSDILLGFAGNFHNPVLISEDRFWIRAFSDCQFKIIYKKCFPNILNEPFHEDNGIDEILSEVAINKLVIFPFISNEELVTNKYYNVRPSYTQNRLNIFYNESFSRLEKLKSRMSKFIL